MSGNQPVLYVDDEVSNLFYFEKLLKDDLLVFTAGSGEEGLHILRNNPEIHVVFSDMKMPSLNGLQFIEKARAAFGDKHFVIVTNYSINDLVSHALDLGIIRACIQKPIQVDQILHIVGDILNQQE